MQHYYGDIVRRLFMLSGAIMLVALPFLYSSIPSPLLFSIGAVVIISFAAGLVSPPHRWVIGVNTILSGIGILVFGYYAVTAYLTSLMAFFWINEILAIIFFFAFYYSTKTLRSSVALKKEEINFALDMAKMRYAKGEITKDEFEAIKKDLL